MRKNLVQISTAMPRGGANTAGTNRSGAKRRRAMSENSTADGPDAGRNLVGRVSVEQLKMDIDKTGSEA